jgi:hypothetical protein
MLCEPPAWMYGGVVAVSLYMEFVMTNSKWTRVFAVAMAALMLPFLAAAKGRMMPKLSPQIPSKPVVVHSSTVKTQKKATTSLKKPSLKSSKSKTTKLHTKSSKSHKLTTKTQPKRKLAHRPALKKN